MKLRANLAVALALALAAAIVAGCGGGDSTEDSSAEAGKANLVPVKTYLTDHSADLEEQVGLLQEKADEYYALAKSVDFDYERLLREHGDEVAEILADSKDIFVVANPAYEQMEGIVAGVPRLAHYDVDIDAGSDASTPEDAVSFSLQTPDGEDPETAGQPLLPDRDRALRDQPRPARQGRRGRRRRRAARSSSARACRTRTSIRRRSTNSTGRRRNSNEDAQEFEPTPSDALTSIVIMTPTMSEYFEAWKNSRFIAGEGASELGFVATSRLSDIADILGGILVTYDGMEPEIATENAQQAKQTKKELQSLVDFAADLRDREADGEKFTAQQADALGAQAQSQAEAIAGQVTQAAKELEIELQEG